ncbi:MAG: 5-methylthioadenosine/S-adenosylhomocysteine deaminase, partial [Litorivivens sp.]
MTENNQNQLILSPKWLVPVIPKGVVLTDHSLVIKGEAIQDLLPRGDAIEKYPGYTETNLPEHVLTAGFINAHG